MKLPSKFIISIAEAISELTGLPEKEVSEHIEVPPKPEMGDYSFPCFAISSKMKKSPQTLASQITQNFPGLPFIRQIQAKGPYINFFLDRAQFTKDVLGLILQEAENYGKSEDGLGKTTVIDYSSPNIAKPFGIGHLRSTVIGAAIKRLYEMSGYRVVGINHLGDWGTQIGKMMVAFKKWKDEKELKERPVRHLYDLYVRFHREAETDPNLDDLARDAFARLESGDKDALEFWREFVRISMLEFEKIYHTLGVSFDYYQGESFYNDKTEPIIGELRKKGLAIESEGAIVVPLEEMPACMLKKADGATLYATRDLAAAKYRYETYRFDKMLYVVGTPQELHFKQVFKVLLLAGYEWAKNCHHVAFGHILGMSTREGTIVLLEDVLNEAVSRAQKVIAEKNPDLIDKEQVATAVGIGAVIFNDLKSHRLKDVVFDWERMLSFDGETGPYLQYTHVRLAGILRHFQTISKFKIRNSNLPQASDFSLICSDEEWALTRHLENYPRIILRAAEEFEPSILSTYLLELAADFNKFYQVHRVVTEDINLTLARISLITCLKTVLRQGLCILGLAPLETM
jgi:arginyl-tRNA synthetase